MNFDTDRFGMIEFEEKDIINLTEEMLGFPKLKSFVLLNKDLPEPYRWLQSIERPDVAFILTPPTIAVKEYQFKISKNDRKTLKITKKNEEKVFVYSIMVVRDNFVSVNLKAPVVINTQSNLAKQIILTDSDYPVRYLLYQKAM